MKKSKRKKPDSTMDAISTMQRRKLESNLELAGTYNSKKFNNVRKKATLTPEQKSIHEKELENTKESAKHIDDMLMEIEKRQLETNFETVLSIHPKINKISDDFVNKPTDDEVKNYRKNTLNKQKKYWG